MGGVRVKYLRKRRNSYFFEATPAMKRAGIFSEPLGPDLPAAIARAAELYSQWRQIEAPAPAVNAGTVSWLIDQYQRSTWYTALAPRTQESVDRHLLRIKAMIGKAGVKAIARHNCRRIHNELSTRYSPANANETIKWLRRLLQYGVEIGLRETNPATGMGLKSRRIRRPRWTPEEVDAFCARATAMDQHAWALAVRIGYDTSQRLADVLAVTWHQFDGEGLTFIQAKTGAEVWTPLSAATVALLTGIERRGVQIIVSKRKPITQRAYFRRVFEEIKAAAGIRPELWFKDLRGTAASEILEAGGRSEPITGHEPGSSIIRRYERPSKDAARAAQSARWKGKP